MEDPWIADIQDWNLTELELLLQFYQGKAFKIIVESAVGDLGNTVTH
jgi:hypothetical protein